MSQFITTNINIRKLTINYIFYQQQHLIQQNSDISKEQWQYTVKIKITNHQRSISLTIIVITLLMVVQCNFTLITNIPLY